MSYINWTDVRKKLYDIIKAQYNVDNEEIIDMLDFLEKGIKKIVKKAYKKSGKNPKKDELNEEDIIKVL